MACELRCAHASSRERAGGLGAPSLCDSRAGKCTRLPSCVACKQDQAWRFMPSIFGAKCVHQYNVLGACFVAMRWSPIADDCKLLQTIAKATVHFLNNCIFGCPDMRYTWIFGRNRLCNFLCALNLLASRTCRWAPRARGTLAVFLYWRKRRPGVQKDAG